MIRTTVAAERMGVSVASLYGIMEKYGVSRPRQGYWLEEDVERVRQHREKLRAQRVANFDAARRRKRDVFNERNAKIVEQVKSGRTYGDVGAEHGITKERVRQICALFGVISSEYSLSSQKRAERDQRIVGMAHDGITVAGIAEKLGMPVSAVERVLQAAGISRRSTRGGRQWDIVGDMFLMAPTTAREVADAWA